MTAQTQSGESAMQPNRKSLLRAGAASKGRRTDTRRIFLLAAFFLAGCTVGPNYVRPKAEVPTDFKENKDWKVAQPSAEAIKGKWWEVYQDPQLNSLEER